MESQYKNKKQFIINIIYISIIALLVYVIIRYGISLFSPFIFAFLFAYFLKKPAWKISLSTKLPYKLVSFLIVLIFYILAGIIVFSVGLKLTSMVTRFVMLIPSFYERQLGPFLMNTFNIIESAVYSIDPAVVGVLSQGFNQLVSALGTQITNLSLSLVGSISNIASSLPGLFIKTILMIITTFFIAIDFDFLSSFIKRQFSKKTNEIIITIKDYMINTVFVVIRSYALIMFITFIELSIGLSILKIRNPVLIAFLIAIFDILPVLGTGGIMIPWVIISLLQRNFQRSIGLFVIYIFVTIVRNIIEPRIVGKQLGLHPVVTLISMFVGAKLFGVIGLFGFPITLSLLMHLNKTEVIKIFK
mgnify:CR=1 FL=1